MARPPRIQLTGAIYHVMARGNRKGIIFDDDIDRRRFLEVLTEASERYRLGCLSYCLMGNHYHAVIETADRNLSDAMHFVNGVFAQASNLRHGRTGHVLEGRFRSIVIDNDIYLWNANLYVVLNPVAAGLVSHPAEWPWSSFRATAGLDEPPALLRLEWLDWALGGKTRHESQRRYRDLLTAPTAMSEITEADVFGSPQLEATIRSELGARHHQVRLPRSYKALARPNLSEIFEPPLTKTERDEQVVRAHVVHGYRLSEIAHAIRVHPNTLSRIVRALKKRSC
jgi:REP element-mobilizing transposase RayT